MGLTLALAVVRRGIPAVVLEERDSVGYGSRAICISRRSLEILHGLGVGRRFLDKGLPWTGGRSFFRDKQVLAFAMPSEPVEQHPRHGEPPAVLRGGVPGRRSPV